MLTGLNLQIANAAWNSGFNTFNHVALLNLIWSVKRFIHPNMRAEKSNPPIHPIYPDRYRPSDVGVNTQRKRRVQSRVEPPPFHPVQPLMRKKPTNVKKDTSSIFSGTGRSNVSAVDKGTRDHPICLDSDDEEQLASSVGKRRKLNDGRASTLQSRPKFKSMPGRFKVEVSSPVQKDNIQSATDLTRELASVRRRLQETQTIMTGCHKTMDECRLTMRSVFNTYGDKLGAGEAFDIMDGLAEALSNASGKATDGHQHVNKAIRWIDIFNNSDVKQEADKRDEADLIL